MLLDDINKGLYIMDISKKYNVSHTTIRKYFKKYNIENINNGRQKFFGNQ
jgi:transposase